MTFPFANNLVSVTGRPSQECYIFSNRLLYYPAFLGLVSSIPTPLSLRTSFSLLRRIDSLSLVKEPLRFRLLSPSWPEPPSSEPDQLGWPSPGGPMFWFLHDVVKHNYPALIANVIIKNIFPHGAADVQWNIWWYLLLFCTFYRSKLLFMCSGQDFFVKWFSLSVFPLLKIARRLRRNREGSGECRMVWKSRVTQNVVKFILTYNIFPSAVFRNWCLGDIKDLML